MNGSSLGSKTTFPNTITFGCDEGFVLKGSNARTCLSNGTWSGEKTFCEGTVILNEATGLIMKNDPFSLVFLPNVNIDEINSVFPRTYL